MKTYDLSLVVPSYNSALWLPSTLDSVYASLQGTSLTAEVLIVNDGSTDDTEAVVSSYRAGSDLTIRIVNIPNGGVYEAVRIGAREAASERLLIVNSRLLIDPSAFKYLEQQINTEPLIETRNGHVATDNSVPLVGRFWEVPTHVFWGAYLRRPVVTEITEANFDSVPKGTGFLVVERSRLLDAYEALGEVNSQYVSDDTRLLRHIAGERPILLEPGFKATYRPRTSLKKFLSHARLRGTLFVDSYYGTSAVRTAALWCIALSIPIALAALLVSAFTGNWTLPIIALAVFLLLVASLVSVSLINRAPARAVQSFLIYVVPFALVFWAGITRGLWLRMRGVTQ